MIPERWKADPLNSNELGYVLSALRNEGPLYLPRLVEALEDTLAASGSGGKEPCHCGACENARRLLSEIQKGPQ